MPRMEKPRKKLISEHLQVEIFNDRKEMGIAAGKTVGSRIKNLLQEQRLVTMVFAAAPSQNDFLAALAGEPGIDWQRIIALHMDEYVGLSTDSPQRFGKYLEDHIID